MQVLFHGNRVSTTLPTRRGAENGQKTQAVKQASAEISNMTEILKINSCKILIVVLYLRRFFESLLSQKMVGSPRYGNYHETYPILPSPSRSCYR
jgi:hypothetical protein